MTNYNSSTFRFGTSGLFFIQGFTVVSWASRLLDIRQKFNLTDGQLGAVLLIPPLAQLAMMAFSGILVRRFGSGRVARVGFFLLPFLLPVLGEVPTIPGLAAAMFLFGLTTNLANIAANTQGLNVERLYGKSIMASFHGCWSAGGVCAILFSIILTNCGTSLRVNFFAAWAVCMIVYCLVFSKLIIGDMVSQVKKNCGKQSLWSANLLLFGLICFGCLGCEGSINSWITLYYKGVVRTPDSWIRLGFFVYMAAVTFSRFSADLFVRKSGEYCCIRIAGVLIFLGFLLIVACPHLVTASAGCILLGFGTSAIVPICYSLTGKQYGDSLPVALSIVNGISFTGFLLMPALVGGISGFTGLRMAFAVFGVLSVACISLILLVEKRECSENEEQT